MTIIRRLFCLVAVLLSPMACNATCSILPPTGMQTGYINFGTVLVQRDSPVGTVLATAQTGALDNGNNLVSCTTTYTAETNVVTYNIPSTLGNNIYRTNLSGVGIRFMNATGIYEPNSSTEPAPSALHVPAPGYQAQLIKTGDIESGDLLPSATLLRATVNNSLTYVMVQFKGINAVQTQSCSVDNTNIQVPLGDHKKSEFSGTNSFTDWQKFTIGLSCDSGTHVHIQIDATQDPSDMYGVMALDSGDDVATGVGVQLWDVDANNAVTFGESKDKGFAVSGKQTLNYQARYYETKSSITAGTANATATFTLTYK